MARKARTAIGVVAPRYEMFDFEERTYQIDPNRNKVYRRFVEIETAKASQILILWRARPASA